MQESTEINIYDILLRVVARVSARIFVGMPMCRNEEWLDASIQYTENVFLTALLLRMVPPLLRPIVQWLLPSSYRLHGDLRLGKRLISSLVDERRKLEAKNDKTYGKSNDVLQWMMDAAEGEEDKPDKLAHRQLLLTIASIHTTTMAASHAMYDLCANPEFITPLREEIKQQLDSEGNFNVTALNDMRKLDSFMKESQRLNPLNLSMHPLPPPPMISTKKKPSILTGFYSCLQPRRQRTRHPLRWRPPPPQHPLLCRFRPHPHGPNHSP